MDKLNNHEGFWGPAEELIDRAKCLQKNIGVNLKAITVRLVRYYSAEGVIEKPDRLGREAAYHYKHLLQLLLARKLSEHGATLADIKMLLAGQSVLELEGNLKGSVQPLLDEVKRRRAKETAEKSTNVAIPEAAKANRSPYNNPDLDGLTFQLKQMGEAIKTVIKDVDTLGKANLELAVKNENLHHTIDDVRCHLRESVEYQKHMATCFERLTQRIDHTEAMAREQQIDLHLLAITNTIQQLAERLELTEGSLHALVTAIRETKS